MINNTIFLLALFFMISINNIYSQFRFESYALHQVNLIDVHQKQVIENQTLLIHKDRIVGIYNANEFVRSDTIQNINLKGHYVIPGLIDAHVHLGTNPSSGDELEITKKRLNHLLLNGVTTVRDMAGDARYLNYLSRQAALDDIPSPDIHFSALFAGESFFKDPRTQAAAQGFPAGAAPWMRAINLNTDINQITIEAKGTGATGIKIYANLDEAYIQRIVQAAHAQGMKVWAHATVFPARPSEVCQAGVDVMSHASYLAWEGEQEIPSDASFRKRKHKQFDAANEVFLRLVEQMKNKQTILDATVAVVKDSTQFQYGVSLTKLAYENGVKIGIGTDLPIDLSTAAPIFQEIKVLNKEVGIKPIDIICGATIINAEMIGQEHNIGSIEAGKKANLLILKNNPMVNIENIKNLKIVIKNGQLFNPK